ncbi:hypothetical protein OO013_05025 [Mangrovivirga sp. M17]|uniref:Uncharacterized protein n=1 Tax=Mangrovivirga halotolerans TaxID=2993936 RepID=A0ABT3RPX1_9BACT|nr:hypothetical protein [Mangrovivirga halotolerans]MCX2743215.1 hypothetical protein [Mangrovivirga halotolerans]
MTQWEKESDMRGFAKNGSHLNAMKNNKNIAREIRTITIETDKLPTWKEAKLLLSSGKALKY